MEKDFKSRSFVNGNVSFWMNQIGMPTSREPLAGSKTADVVIVGAGLTGLWAAYYVKKAAPERSVVVIEREFAGFGASGRNGGWLSAEPAGFFETYARRSSRQAAVALQQQMFGAVKESVEVAEKESIEADIAFDGLTHVATNKAQMSRLQSKVAALQNSGWAPEDLSFLDANQVADIARIDGARGGYSTQHCARIHPAKFVRGLADIVEKLGVEIFEQTRALRIADGKVFTDRGVVSGNVVVRALEGYTKDLEGEARTLLPMNSSMIITEPLTDSQLELLGWETGTLIGDMAHSFTYMQRTADGRLAIGGRGVPYNFNSSFDRRGRTAERAVGQLHARLVELFPYLTDVKLSHSWSGVLGVPRDWSAGITIDESKRHITAGGYVGHGLAGSNLAGRTVRDLILDVDTPLTALPWVGHSARSWEPEPLRWIGANLLYRIYGFADKFEYRSNSPETNLLAKVSNVISGRK